MMKFIIWALLLLVSTSVLADDSCTTNTVTRPLPGLNIVCTLTTTVWDTSDSYIQDCPGYYYRSK